MTDITIRPTGSIGLPFRSEWGGNELDRAIVGAPTASALVSYFSIKLALANPSDSLRYE